MSDSEIHSLCKNEVYLKEHRLDMDIICDCGKMKELDVLLPKLKSDVSFLNHTLLFANMCSIYIPNFTILLAMLSGPRQGGLKFPLSRRFSHQSRPEIA